MVIPWLYHGYTMIIPWLYHGYTMVMPWLCHGYAMVMPWLYHGYTMVMPWLCHGYAMVIPWLYHGYTMVIPWLYHGYTMVIPWLYHGYTMSNEEWSPPKQFRHIFSFPSQKRGSHPFFTESRFSPPLSEPNDWVGDLKGWWMNFPWAYHPYKELWAIIGYYGLILRNSGRFSVPCWG